MSTIAFIATILTILWLLAWTASSIRELAAGKRDSILYVIPVLFIYTGLPLIADFIWGVPEYDRQPGYSLATEDPLTTIIYCLYVSAVPLILHRLGRHQSELPAPSDSDLDLGWVWRVRPFLQVAAWLPLIVLPLAPIPGIFMEYGAGPVQLLERGNEDSPSASFYVLVLSRVTLLSIVAIGALMLSQRKKFIMNLALYFGPLLFVAVWLNGKRTSVILAVVVLLFALWYKGYLRGKRLYGIGVLSVILFAAFSYTYQAEVRNRYDTQWGVNQMYEEIRIDYGRDNRIKMVLYAELNPDEMRILEYRGQTILYYLGIWIPRDMWEAKPYPYAQYFTAAMELRPPELLHGGMTTSWLDEAVANFGWVGLIVGPLTFAAICRLGDRRQSGVVSLLTGLVAILLLSVHLVAFLPIFAVWLLAVLYPKRLAATGKAQLARASEGSELEYYGGRGWR